MSAQVFPYCPLSEPDSFRILHLQPSSERSAQIYCKLEHTRLSRYDYDIIDPYTALSYVWGDSSDPRTIQVDGQPVAITRNLHDALECLRDDKRVLSMWADAICINQSDIPERNSQVKQMGRIYSSATHTVIFLDSSSRGLDVVLREFGQVVGDEPDISIEQLELVWSHFSHIMSQPWFRRVWILQELVLSKDPFVQCGTTRVRWNMFCSFGKIIGRLEGRFVESRSGEDSEEEVGGVAPPGSHIAQLRQQRNSKSWEERTPVDFPVLHDMSRTRDSYHWDTLGRARASDNTLSILVVSRRGYGASDPRDIIYAQVSLASKTVEDNPTNIEVDYSNSIARVYAEMSYHMLKGGIDTFTLLERRNIILHHLGLPSWVPDWSKSWDPTLRWHGSRRSIKGKPKMLDNLRFPSSRLVYLPNDKHALVMEVLLVGEIVQMGGAAGLTVDLPEEKSTTDYFEPGMTQDEIQILLDAWVWPRPDLRARAGDKSHLIDAGFGRMLLAWASAIGLPQESLLPQDDVPCIAEGLKKGLYAQLWQSKRILDRPFLLLALHYQFVISSDYDPLGHWNQFPLIATDRFCTIKCKYPHEGKEKPYQIIVVPETSQVGDMIANIELEDLRSLVVIRPIQLIGVESEALPPTYEVVGTCHSNADIKGTLAILSLSDLVALV
ncbi:heterokaryon incompatibility protein-domain-containing protein [Leptodontidium sp. MPI-SDFR-AT-0119]|nr:heterokaryon incompatibility protein-domain-containing protein [Leptodontidium sp. MPI-SDFR-AT-0119]